MVNYFQLFARHVLSLVERTLPLPVPRLVQCDWLWGQHPQPQLRVYHPGWVGYPLASCLHLPARNLRAYSWECNSLNKRMWAGGKRE